MKRVLLSNVLVAVVVGAGLWLARGAYDRAFLDEGVFHVVNAGAAERSIQLVFPSGERRSAVVPAGRSVDFRVENTGEGAVTVLADGRQVGSAGYVTSHNGLTILVVQPEDVLFSQVLRSQLPGG